VPLQPEINGKPAQTVSEAVVVDPAAKIAQNIRQGGNVQASTNALGKDLTAAAGHWPWQGILEWLLEQLDAPGWENRHGASLALRDLLRQQGGFCGTMRSVTPEHNARRKENCLLRVAHAIVKTLILDRFGDFVGDQVVAPVREASAQALGSVLKLMTRSSVSIVHGYLMDMIAQPWQKVEGGHRKGYAWEVRHAGLLGLMYEVAVRPDIIAEPQDIKPAASELEADGDIEMADGRRYQFLEKVLAAAMLGYAT
jgi:TATA-binding protein-associated factor